MLTPSQSGLPCPFDQKQKWYCEFIALAQLAMVLCSEQLLSADSAKYNWPQLLLVGQICCWLAGMPSIRSFRLAGHLLWTGRLVWPELVGWRWPCLPLYGWSVLCGCQELNEDPNINNPITIANHTES